MLKSLQFRHWAQPVVSRPWAVVAVLVWRVQWLTGHHLHGKYAHKAWQRSCGI